MNEGNRFYENCLMQERLHNEKSKMFGPPNIEIRITFSSYKMLLIVVKL